MLSPEDPSRPRLFQRPQKHSKAEGNRWTPRILGVWQTFNRTKRLRVGSSIDPAPTQPPTDPRRVLVACSRHCCQGPRAFRKLLRCGPGRALPATGREGRKRPPESPIRSGEDLWWIDPVMSPLHQRGTGGVEMERWSGVVSSGPNCGWNE